MKKSNRRSFFGKVGLMLSSFFFLKVDDLFYKGNALCEGGIFTESEERIYFANGFKVSEVSQSEAIIWTRLCSKENPSPISHKRSKQEGSANNFYPVNFNEAQEVQFMDGAINGTEGLLRVKIQGDANQLVTCLLYTSDAADDLLCVDLG